MNAPIPNPEQNVSKYDGNAINPLAAPGVAPDPFDAAGNFEIPADLLPTTEQDTRPILAAPSSETPRDPAAAAQPCPDDKHTFETFPLFADDPILLCLECGAVKDPLTGTIQYPGQITFAAKPVLTPHHIHTRRTTETLDELARLHAQRAVKPIQHEIDRLKADIDLLNLAVEHIGHEQETAPTPACECEHTSNTSPAEYARHINDGWHPAERWSEGGSLNIMWIRRMRTPQRATILDANTTLAQAVLDGSYASDELRVLAEREVALTGLPVAWREQRSGTVTWESLQMRLADRIDL